VWAARTPAVGRGREIEPIAALDAWREAGELVDELLALPGPDQPAAAEARYHRTLVVHQLLYRERSVRFQDPSGCLELARLAATVAQAIMRRAGTDWRRYGGLVALALASQANAHRILGQTVDAAETLAPAEAYMRGENDLRLRGEYFGTAGAVLTALRRLDEAKAATENAIAHFRRLGDYHRVAVDSVIRAGVDHAAGAVDRDTAFCLRRALDYVDSSREPEGLEQLIRLNLVVTLAELRLVGEAESAWREIPPFPTEIEDVHRRAALGQIAMAKERWDDACGVFSEAIETLSEAGHNAAEYYRLLLAAGLIGAGRSAEANRVSREVGRFFSAAKVKPIAMAATALLAEADRGTASLLAIRELKRTIDAASR
jgi:tetratricopeptide (TPR) repeat protein